MTVHRDLTALSVGKLLSAKKEGRWRVSPNLYLQTKETGSGSWLLRYQKSGSKKNCWLGLGKAKLFALAEAKLRAAKYMKLLADGIDPLEHKRAGKQKEADAKRDQQLAAITFKRVATEFIKSRWQRLAQQDGREQWHNGFALHVHPVIGDLSIGSVDTAAIMRVLSPIWTTRTETAKRLRGRLEQVLDYARASGYRDGENPARWRGHLDHMLARPSKLHRVQHFAALDYRDMPKLMAELANRYEPAARALEFTILTAARSNEVLAGTWAEIDLERAVWAIPAERMKMGREHRVPLSSAALECLGDPPDDGGALFAHDYLRGRKPLGSASPERRMGGPLPGMAGRPVGDVAEGVAVDLLEAAE
jgi:integrase